MVQRLVLSPVDVDGGDRCSGGADGSGAWCRYQSVLLMLNCYDDGWCDSSFCLIETSDSSAHCQLDTVSASPDIPLCVSRDFQMQSESIQSTDRLPAPFASGCCLFGCCLSLVASKIDSRSVSQWSPAATHLRQKGRQMSRSQSAARTAHCACAGRREPSDHKVAAAAESSQNRSGRTDPPHRVRQPSTFLLIVGSN